MLARRRGEVVTRIGRQAVRLRGGGVEIADSASGRGQEDAGAGP